MLHNSEKDFLKRHIGPSKDEQSKMLKKLNYESLDDLIKNTVADTRDGACSSSTLKEASSWGKVDITKEQMVFAEANENIGKIILSLD